MLMVPWWWAWPSMRPVGAPSPNEPPICADVAIGAMGAVGINVGAMDGTEEDIGCIEGIRFV